METDLEDVDCVNAPLGDVDETAGIGDAIVLMVICREEESLAVD